MPGLDVNMNLHCQHCGERIVARGFGKCPGCYRDLPEELQITLRERKLEEMEKKWREANEWLNDVGAVGGDVSDIPSL